MDQQHIMTRAERDELYQLSADIRRIADTLMPLEVSARPVTADSVRAILRARRLRDEYLGADFFADPAWDMMLDLLAARLEGTRVSVSSVCIAAAVPPTTALRWIGLLERKGAIERRADPIDARRIYLVLSDAMARKMIDFLKLAQSISGPMM